MAPQAVLQNGAATRSLAIDAQDCIMGRVKKTAGYKFAARTYARQKAGSARIIFRTASPWASLPPCSRPFKDKPAVAAENAATLDRRCARRRESNAVGAEECSQRGSNKRMDYKDHVSPLTR